MPRRAPGVFPPAGISVEDERSLFASSRPDEPPIPVHLPLPASTSRERRSVVSGKCRLSSLSVEPRAHGSGGRMQGPRGSHRRDSASREASRRLPFPFAAAMNSSKQALIYSFVAKGSVVLAGHTAFSGNFSTVAVQCLQKLPPNSSSTSTLQVMDGMEVEHSVTLLPTQRRIRKLTLHSLGTTPPPAPRMTARPTWITLKAPNFLLPRICPRTAAATEVEKMVRIRGS